MVRSRTTRHSANNHKFSGGRKDWVACNLSALLILSLQRSPVDRLIVVDIPPDVDVAVNVAVNMFLAASELFAASIPCVFIQEYL